MSSASSSYSHRLMGAARAFALVMLAALVSLFLFVPAAHATDAAPEASDQAVHEEAATTEAAAAEAAQADGAAESSSTEPIKPQPKIEITTGVVTLQPTGTDTITEEAVPLAAFDLDPCFIHLIMVAGIAVTIGYTFFAFKRTRAYTEYMNARTSDLTRGTVLDSEAAPAEPAVVAPAASALRADR